MPWGGFCLPQSDLLLGILDNLDPDMFLHCCADPETVCVEQLPQDCYGEADSLPASPGSPLGPTSPKLEAINELIRFDHEYTKPFILALAPGPAPGAAGPDNNMPVQVKEATSAASHSLVKEEPPDDLLPELSISHLLASSTPNLQASPCLLDAASDSGYEGSPSPFSDLSSPLGTAEYTWDDAFANELFPQLISV